MAHGTSGELGLFLLIHAILLAIVSLLGIAGLVQLIGKLCGFLTVSWLSVVFPFAMIGVGTILYLIVGSLFLYFTKDEG